MAGAAQHQLPSSDDLGLQSVSSFQTDPRIMVQPPTVCSYEQRTRASTTSVLLPDQETGTIESPSPLIINSVCQLHPPDVSMLHTCAYHASSHLINPTSFLFCFIVSPFPDGCLYCYVGKHELCQLKI